MHAQQNTGLSLPQKQCTHFPIFHSPMRLSHDGVDKHQTGALHILLYTQQYKTINIQSEPLILLPHLTSQLTHQADVSSRRRKTAAGRQSSLSACQTDPLPRQTESLQCSQHWT